MLLFAAVLLLAQQTAAIMISSQHFLAGSKFVSRSESLHKRGSCIKLNATSSAEALDAAHEEQSELLPELVFLHIPKNGGTAIEAAGWRHGILWGRHMDFKQCSFGRARRKCSPWHIPPGYMQAPNLYSETQVFCAVRHPYERAISHFRWTVARLGYDQSIACTAETMNMYLELLYGPTYYQADNFMQDCHLLPQSQFIWDEHGHQWCTHILRMENFPDEFNTFMKQHDFPVHLDEPANKGACHNLGVADLDNKSLALLNSVYVEDFSRLDFRKHVETSSGPPHLPEQRSSRSTSKYEVAAKVAADLVRSG